MFEMKFKDAVQGAKLATKLVTAVTIFGLATGCVSEQVRNDDPSQDLPALVLNDESADSSGSMSASPEASESSDSAGDLSLDESQPSMGTADGSLSGSLSESPSSSADLAYTPPAELPPLAPSPSSSIDSSMDQSAPTKKVAKKSSKKSKKVASKKKKKSSKIAKKSAKKNKKAIAKKAKESKKENVAAAAAIAADIVPPAPPAPPADGITLDGSLDAPPVAGLDSSAASASGSTSAAMDNSSGMNLPADPSSIGSQETTTIEPPLVLSQSPDIAANSDDSFLWICFAAGMVVLAGLVFFKMKRRREVSRY